MSTWADMFPSGPAATPEPELATPGPPQPGDRSTVLVYPSDGPEPPPDVIRLRHPDHLSVDLMRVARGWAWVVKEENTPVGRDFGGWEWARVHEMRPGLWVAIESAEEGDAPTKLVEPPAEVLRARLYKPDGNLVLDEPDTYAYRCIEGGWNWAHEPPVNLPDVGWEWGSSCMNNTASWSDHTTPEDRERHQVYRFDGPEPPAHVVRLRITGPAKFRATSTGEQRHLARCPEDGWWSVQARQGDVPNTGWAWADKSSLPHRMVQVFPRLDPGTTEGRRMIDSLVSALPRDDEWYRIGVDESSGLPVWAWNDGDETDFMVSDTDPR